MKREERWEVIAEVHTAVQAAVDEWGREPTPQARAAMEAAFREYVERLPLVVDQVEVSKFEESLRLFQEALGQMEQLHATLSARSVDDADIAFFEQLTAKRVAAGNAFEAAKDALHLALERALARDTEPSGEDEGA